MVSQAVFLAAIIVPAVSAVVLVVWSTLLFLQARSLLQSRPVPPAPLPLLPNFAALPSRPPNHHLATSDYPMLERFPERPLRPPSFLLIDPTATSNAVVPPPRTNSTNRVSIATTVSRSGNRVLTRNPSSQNSHETIKSKDTRYGTSREGEPLVIERTKRKRKSYGVRNEEVESGFGPHIVAAGVRRRSSTWTTEDLGRLWDPALGTRDAQPAKRYSLPRVPPKRLSLNLRHDTPISFPSFSTPPESQNVSPFLPSDAAFTPCDSRIRQTQSQPDRRYSYTAPSSANLPPRFSASSQALLDLEGYAAGISRPSTPSFFPLSYPNSQPVVAEPPRTFSDCPPPSSLPFDRAPQDSVEYDGRIVAPRLTGTNLRPLSWVKRQGSSGTLPERIHDAQLAIANPDETRTSLSTARSTSDADARISL